MEEPTTESLVRKNIEKDMVALAEEVIGKPSDRWPSLTRETINGMVDVFLDAFELFVSKNQDYGTANISTAGELGIMMRIRDKVNRLKNLFANSRLGDYKSEVNHEPIEDSFIDIGVLGLMGLAAATGRWPDVDNDMRIL